VTGGARLFVHNLENSVRLPQTVEAVIALARLQKFRASRRFFLSYTSRLPLNPLRQNEIETLSLERLMLLQVHQPHPD